MTVHSGSTRHSVKYESQVGSGGSGSEVRISAGVGAGGGSSGIGGWERESTTPSAMTAPKMSVSTPSSRQNSLRAAAVVLSRLMTKVRCQ